MISTTQNQNRESNFYIIPAELVTLKEVNYSAAEKRHLKKVLPWLLEDQLLDDVNDLHISSSIINEEKAVVAIIRKDTLTDIIKSYQSSPTWLIPEQLSLPWEDEQWTIYADGKDDRWIIRTSLNYGFFSQLSDLPILLSKTNIKLNPPKKIVFYSEDIESNKVIFLNILKQINLDICDISIVYHSHTVFTDTLRPNINLLQGEFSPKIPWMKLYHQWKIPLISINILLLSYFVHIVADYAVQKTNEQNLRHHTEQAYRSAIPTGNIVNPALQLKRKIEENSTNESSNLLQILHSFGQVLNNEKKSKILSFDYNASKNLLLLTLESTSQDFIETLKKESESHNIKISILNNQILNGTINATIEVSGK